MADLFSPAIHSPQGGPTGPRLWVRRLAIFKDPQTLIRDVPLKPGLNIIWSPDMASSGALAHGSGKTTFCRLLRACLGEAAYATEAQQSRIMTQFPKGRIAAEIIIDTVCWVAVRPFGFPDGEFVVQATSIEEVIAHERQAEDHRFIDPVVIDAFFSTIIGSTPPGVKADQIWDIFRAWMTRDQECRLADILAWRSSRTQSRSRAQVLGEVAKLTMVRLALGAFDREERDAVSREQQLEAAIERERRDQAYHNQRQTEDLKAIRTALGVGDDIGFDDTIEHKGLITLAETALAEAMRTDLPKPPNVASIFARSKALNKEHSELNDQKRKFDGDVEIKRTNAQRYASEAAIGEIDITQGRVRVCPVCKVQIDEALAKGCGISLERCDLPALRAAIESKRKQAAQLETEANRAEAESNRITALIEQLAPRIQALAAEAKDAETASQAATDAAKQVQDNIYLARRTLDDVRALHRGVTAPKPTPPSTSELATIRAQIDQGRRRARAAIRTLEERYQGIMAAWLPNGVEGAIKLDGNGLKVDAQFSGRGEISTAALDSLSIVAFDLAALHMAVEEKAALPAFLIHDSPREADLDGALYARLFSLIHQWEIDAVTPCFQYIVTTTTAPPNAVQTDHFVRLRMSSTPADMRLFRMDI